MPDNGKPRRIALGFHAGGALALRLAPAHLEDLRAALAAGQTGWKEIEAEDGSVRLNLAHVLWVRIENDEHRVGFGIASTG